MLQELSVVYDSISTLVKNLSKYLVINKLCYDLVYFIDYGFAKNLHIIHIFTFYNHLICNKLGLKMCKSVGNVYYQVLFF